MKTKSRKTKVADSYLQLIMEFPLRPIRDEKDYDTAMNVLEKLAVAGEKQLDKGQRDYLDALDEFITLYDRKHFAFPPDVRTPLNRLKYAMAESQTTPELLRRILDCSQPLVSMILNGNRELSKDNIRALATHFKVEPGLFF